MKKNIKRGVVILLFFVVVLILVNLSLSKQNYYDINNLDLKSKIGQMIITLAYDYTPDIVANNNLGGIHILPQKNAEDYEELIRLHQNKSKIKLLVTTDLEGCFNNLEPIYNSKYFPELKDDKESEQLGEEHGKILHDLGININFNPVVDVGDTIWGCRSFSNDSRIVEERALTYINGLQKEQVYATLKHFPGKTLVVNDSHDELVSADIKDTDLDVFYYLMNETNISFVLVSHLIVNGSIDSGGKPSSGSFELIQKLRERYDGLIITDDLLMLGNTDYYENEEQMLVQTINSGVDLLLYFNPNKISEVINLIAKNVKEGNINESRIDDAVNRILKFKNNLN